MMQNLISTCHECVMHSKLMSTIFEFYVSYILCLCCIQHHLRTNFGRLVKTGHKEQNLPFRRFQYRKRRKRQKSIGWVRREL
jgi:hypothetical protein